jgi:hypothetical protein
MQITLSPDAVAVLRFEIKGYRSKVLESRLPAYRELTAAGIMEPVPGSDTEYRFTADGMKHREEIAEREAARIERDRYEPPDADLSETARERLRLHLAGDREVTVENRPAYRELVAARIFPCRSNSQWFQWRPSHGDWAFGIPKHAHRQRTAS